MAVLHVRNVPEGLRVRLAQLARSERRSVNAEVLHLLTKAIGAERPTSVSEILERARRIRAAATRRRTVSSLRELQEGRRDRER
jgi:plasmid stability protein